jgi:hypothetical protein
LYETGNFEHADRLEEYYETIDHVGKKFTPFAGQINTAEYKNDDYKLVLFTPTTEKELMVYPAGEYWDYEHFVLVMGKFNPYFQALEKPMKLDVINYNEIKKVFPEFNRIMYGEKQ